VSFNTSANSTPRLVCGHSGADLRTAPGWRLESMREVCDVQRAPWHTPRMPGAYFVSGLGSAALSIFSISRIRSWCSRFCGSSVCNLFAYRRAPW